MTDIERAIAKARDLEEKVKPGDWGLAREGKISCIDTAGAGAFNSRGFYAGEWDSAVLAVHTRNTHKLFVDVVEAAKHYGDKYSDLGKALDALARAVLANGGE